MSAYTIGWLAWIGWFAVEEGLALASGSTPNTLSGHVWHWFAIKGQPRWWQARRAALAMFLAWLCLHFLTGGAF